ncbi:MAG TPA: hypothetical protein VNO82_23040 [Solirubrobacteraceae bacterium]|nr:hypothetical protein [Solirubrobacteraceae bacterium]
MAQQTVAELLDRIAGSLRSREADLNRRRAAVGLPPISLDPDKVELRATAAGRPSAPTSRARQTLSNARAKLDQATREADPATQEADPATQEGIAAVTAALDAIDKTLAQLEATGEAAEPEIDELDDFDEFNDEFVEIEDIDKDKLAADQRLAQLKSEIALSTRKGILGTTELTALAVWLNSVMAATERVRTAPGQAREPQAGRSEPGTYESPQRTVRQEGSEGDPHT